MEDANCENQEAMCSSAKPIDQNELVQNLDKISTNKKVIVHCRSGKRSADAIRDLQNLGDFDNLYNLKGGILEYSKEIDASIPTY